MTFQIEQIGVIHSCFKEKFGIPRQPGLVPDARAILELLPPYNREEAVRGMEGFSHVWISFIFHEIPEKEWKPTVRPPRLGGNKRVGVFATRSTFRPNPIGLSAVELEKITYEKSRVLLHLKGVDLLDKTPVIDIKPYIPYSDSIPDAKGGFAGSAPLKSVSIDFSDGVTDFINSIKNQYPFIKELIKQILENDPRPAYYSGKDEDQTFGMSILEFNIRWKVSSDKVLVTQITQID